MVGPVWRSIGSTNSRALGARPRNRALVTDPWTGPGTCNEAAPLPAMVAATCVPWPSVSVRRLVCVPTVKTRLVVRSGWVQSMPESFTLTTTLLPVSPR